MILIQPQAVRLKEYEVLARCEDLDFEVLELSFPDTMGSRELLTAYNRRPVKALHGAFIDLNVASSDPDIRRISRERCRESCRMAVELGAARVIFHTSFIPYLGDNGYQSDWVNRCAEFYLQLINDYGFMICVENFSDRSPAMLYRLINAAKNPLLQICMDVGHANLTGTPLEEWFDVLGPYIGCLHFSDNNGVYDEHLPMGEGNCRWETIDRLCRSLKREIPVTLEVGKLENISDSLEYLKKNIIYPFTKGE